MDAGDLFVGRQQELAILRAALDDAFDGRGRIVMLAGEPGIGKTRLAAAISEVASTVGAHIAWGRCRDDPSTPPFWPWTQVLRSFTKSSSGNGSPDAPSTGPERWPENPLGATAGQKQSRVLLFESVTSFLSERARIQPALLVLDDLQWADQSSLALLEYLGDGMASDRFLLVGTCRPEAEASGHPYSRTLGALARLPGFLRLPLEGLGTPHLEELLAEFVGPAKAAKLVAEVTNRTGGNPFYSLQIGQDLARAGEARPDRVPAGVQASIERRVASLGTRCNDALHAGAILGSEFSLEQLQWFLTDEEEPEETLKEAVDTGIVVASERHRTYRFAHDLVREAVLGSIPASRKAQLHAVAAERLEDEHEASGNSPAAEIAAHLWGADPYADPERFVRHSLTAGNAALDSSAYPEARLHFERAYEVARRGPETIQLARVLSGLGKSLALDLERHKLQRAADCLIRAFDLFLRFEERDLALDAALAQFPAVRHVTGLVELYRRALSLTAPDSLPAGRLHAELATMLLYEEGDVRSALESAERALEIAKGKRDVHLEARGRVEISSILATTEGADPGDVLEKLMPAGDLAELANDPRLAFRALTNAISTSLFERNLEEAKAALRRCERLAERVRDRQTWVTLWLHGGRVYTEAGEAELARAYLRRGEELDPAENRIMMWTSKLESSLGNFELAKTCLDRLIETLDMNGRVNFQHMGAAIGLATRFWWSREPYRIDLAEQFALRGIDAPHLDPFTLGTAQDSAALVAAGRGDSGQAGRLYERFVTRATAPTRGRLRFEWTLGLLASSAGRFQEAVGHYQRALEIARRVGLPVQLASTCHGYAAVLIRMAREGRRRDTPRRLKLASALIGEGIEPARRAGMKPLVGWFEGLLAEIELAGASPAGNRASSRSINFGLTEREIAVLHLVAAGKSNVEIARALVISPLTAATHVQNILGKMGAANRTEAASYAHRLGI